MKKFSLKSPLADIRALYDAFDAPLTALDCGQMCALHNPSGKPFCCDICHAVPAAYQQEWNFLREKTDLWHSWRGDECKAGADAEKLRDETPDNMVLLACLGPQACQRMYRALSCRQFPFFPYVTADFRFVGLAFEWEFAPVCWVIQNPDAVTDVYRQQFVALHDRLFALEQEIFESYAIHSARMREVYAAHRRRILLLHRAGGWRLISPGSGRMAMMRGGKCVAPGSWTKSR